MIVLTDDSGTTESESDNEGGFPEYPPKLRAAYPQTLDEDVEAMEVDDDGASTVENEEYPRQATPPCKTSRPHTPHNL